MAWSENRNKSKDKVDPKVVSEKIYQINAVLNKLAGDEDFQDDLKLPIVQKALKHWTNQHRLPPEEALKLQDNRDVVYVLQRFQIIQTVCREARISVPMDLILSRSAQLSPDLIAHVYQAHGVFNNDTASQKSPIHGIKEPSASQQQSTKTAFSAKPEPVSIEASPSLLNAAKPLTPRISSVTLLWLTSSLVLLVAFLLYFSLTRKDES
jgi:hypothetical protein